MAIRQKASEKEGIEIKDTRCFCFTGLNPFPPNLPSLTYYDQDVTITPSGQVFTVDNVSSVTVTLEDPVEVVTRYNPVDDSEIGQMTLQDHFINCYSVYLHCVKKKAAMALEKAGEEE